MSLNHLSEKYGVAKDTIKLRLRKMGFKIMQTPGRGHFWYESGTSTGKLARKYKSQKKRLEED